MKMQLSNRSRDWLSILGIILVNALFVYFWAYKGWVDSDLFSDGWWFDAKGHVIMGFAWGFILLYLIRRYMAWTYVVTDKLFIAIVIISLVALGETIIWEGIIELGLDLFIQPNFASWMAKAQKGAADNILDIIFTTGGGLFSMLLWGLYRKAYAWKWPIDAEKEMIEEEKERAKILSETIQTMRREHQKQILREFFINLRKNRAKKIKPQKD